MGGFAHENYGRIENCHALRVRLEGVGTGAAGICYRNQGVISHCSIQDSYVNYGGCGLVKGNGENALVEYCNVKDVYFTPDSRGVSQPFGFGIDNYGTIDHCSIDGLHAENYSNVSAVYVYANRSGAVISNCSYSNVPAEMKIIYSNEGIYY